MYQLICMSFDGDYVTERPEFESIEDAWEYSNDLGSKWYFYPFHFVIKDVTIKDTPIHLDILLTNESQLLKKLFKRLSTRSDLINCDHDEYLNAIISEIFIMAV